ncbi:hypothetical protein L6452_06016 [Arctium lappa]|uniref:Uncharacterized protein n=1 Tax=Arctium lappa TaxID=4217 RepID=A0ACB9EHE2_ARCLA|nr:hypothetical protein L6452_06016 [Arctium lappa]
MCQNRGDETGDSFTTSADKQDKEDGSKNQDEKQSPDEMKFQFKWETEFEGEIGAKTEKEAETDQATENVKEVETTPAAVTTPAAKTELSREELEIAKTLVKAKLDTPKATPKVKGVVIKEDETEKKRKEFSVAEIKKKGKEKMIESEKPSKKQTQIEIDEEMAKKLQEELEKEEEIQSAKYREIALEMAAKLNEEYQRSLKTVVAAKRVTKKAKRQRLTLKTRQRQPSKTFLANQERRKMINFLKEAIGVPERMFTSMPFGRIEELYKKEMAKLKGDFIQRVEEKTEAKQEETLAQQIGAIKRKKSIAIKPKANRARIEEEEENENERAEEEAEPTLHLQQNEDPVQANPISMKAPEIIFWDILKDNRKEYFRFKRMGVQFEVYETWGKVIRSFSRDDLEKMYKVGTKLYETVLQGTEMSLLKIAMEYLCMMFDPEKVKHWIKDLYHEYGFKKIDHWMLFENCGVYMITIDKNYHEYYLVEKIYDHNRAKLERMLKAKMVCAKGSEMARIVIRRTINQSLGLDPHLGN